MNKAKVLVLIVALITGCTICYYFLPKTKANYGTLVSEKSVEFNTGTKIINMKLQNYQKNNESMHYLWFQKNKFVSPQVFELSGFEDDVLICTQKEIQIGDKENALCLTGDVGAHSQNLQLITYDKDFRALTFKVDGMELPNIVSDLPEIRFLDYNNKKANLLVKMRDYDKNPLADTTDHKYVGDKSGFWEAN